MKFFKTIPKLQIAVILAVWLALYFPHLRSVPGWYGDETIALGLGKNLMSGELAYGAVSNTFVTIVYQPLYLFLTGIGYKATSDIVGARALNILLALGTALTILLIGRKTLTSTIAFVSALIFLCFDQSVIHFRQCFPHNAVTFGAAVAILSVCRSSTRKGSNITAGTGVAFCLGAHPLGIYVAAITGLNRILRPKTWPALIFPSLALILISFTPILATQFEWVREDVVTIFRSHSASDAENSSHATTNLRIFFTQDIFHFGGLAGCLALAIFPRRSRRIAITVFVCLFSLALFRNRSNLTVFYYQATILLPFLSIGLGFLAQRTLLHILRIASVGAIIQPTVKRYLRRYLLIAFTLAATIPNFTKSVNGTLTPRNYPWITQSTTDVENAAAWLNSRTKSSDVVIANSNIAWLLNARTANLLQLTAWNQRKTFMYEYGMPRERFIFSLAPENIRYLVLGDIDQVWGIYQENVIPVLKSYDVEKWPIAWKSKTYLILENPSYNSATTKAPQ